MRKLFAEDSHADADTGQDGLWESGSDGEAVDEVVHAVAEDDHPRDRRDLGPAVLRFQLKLKGLFAFFLPFLLIISVNVWRPTNKFNTCNGVGPYVYLVLW